MKVNIKNLIGSLLLAGSSAFAAPVWQPTAITNDAIIAFAALGDTLFGGTHFGGLKSSIDDGKNWNNVPKCDGVDDASVPALFAQPGFLAAAYEGKGVCITKDAGHSWTSAHSGLPFQPFIRDLEGVGAWLLAGAQASTGGSILYRKPMHEDLPWVAVGNGFDSSVQGIERLTHDENGKLYAAVARRKGDMAWLFTSSDTGITWSPVDSLLPGPIYDLVWTEGFLIAATEHGVFRSSDHGAKWENCGPDFSSTPAYALSARPGLVVAGAGQTVYRSDDAAGSWLWLTEGLPGGDVSVLAVWAGKQTILASISPLKGVFISERATAIRFEKSPKRPQFNRPSQGAWDILGKRSSPDPLRNSAPPRKRLFRLSPTYLTGP